MKYLLTIFLLMMNLVLFGQNQLDESSLIYVIVDEPTTFPGGLTKFNEYVSSKLQRPAKKKKHGKIFIKFAIDTTGFVMETETKVIRAENETLSDEIHQLYDPQIIRVVNSSPAWIPARQRGKKVRQQMVLPISF
jgi:hypothetical protein